MKNNTPIFRGIATALITPLTADGIEMCIRDRRDIALAEYHYFTGHPEEAAQEAQPLSLIHIYYLH